MGRHDSGACGGQAQPSGRFALDGQRGRTAAQAAQGRLRCHSRSSGQGVAGMPQEHQGWVKRPQGWPQVRQELGTRWLLSRRRRNWRLLNHWRLRYVGRLSHHHGRLNCRSCGWAARHSSHLRLRLPGARAPKPSSWPRVNGPAASITTSKVAASLPWWASSAAYSSAWSWQASSSSISARGGYSTCLAGALPRALELTPSSGHLAILDHPPKCQPLPA